MYFIVFADLNYTFIQFQHCTMVSSTNGSTEVKKPFQRLPTGVVPSHYEIFLKPNLSDLNFIGNINVELDVVQQTSELICNAVDLKIDGVKVNGKTFTFESHITQNFVSRTTFVRKGKYCLVLLQVPKCCVPAQKFNCI